jgi:hypothetical protein
MFLRDNRGDDDFSAFMSIWFSGRRGGPSRTTPRRDGKDLAVLAVK